MNRQLLFIMLILVGTVPTAYALKRTVDKGSVTTFAAVSIQVADTLEHYTDKSAVVPNAGKGLEHFVSSHKFQPTTTPAVQQMVTKIRNEAVSYDSLGNVPPATPRRSRCSSASSAINSLLQKKDSFGALKVLRALGQAVDAGHAFDRCSCRVDFASLPR